MSELIDTTAPNSARVWNYWLGGKDHFSADARVGQYCASFYPGMTVLARSCRYFIARVVGYLASTGIRQFLDLGCGLPAQTGDTHQIAQAVVPDAHVVYADHDPVVLAHARALLTCGPPGTTSHLHADLNHPAALLTAARKMLDFTEPIAMLAMNVFGHLGDPAHGDDQAARAIVAQLVVGLPPGSYLAIADRTSTEPLHNLAARAYNASGAAPYHLRRPAQIAQLLAGLTPVPPGIVPIHTWRPDPSPFLPIPVPAWGGVACTTPLLGSAGCQPRERKADRPVPRHRADDGAPAAARMTSSATGNSRQRAQVSRLKVEGLCYRRPGDSLGVRWARARAALASDR